jgi:hypothetical protein
MELNIERTKAVDILTELVKLLEDYAPTWYTEEIHERAEAALRTLRESVQEVVSESRDGREISKSAKLGL